MDSAKLSEPPIAPLDYQRPTTESPRRRIDLRPLAILAASVFITIVVLYAQFTPTIKPTVSSTGPACAGNLGLIHLALTSYAEKHGGRYPDTLEELVSAGNIAPALLICPHSSDTPATGATTQQLIANLQSPGHLSYDYYGKGMGIWSGPDSVLICDPLDKTNHGNGVNVLFRDGHTEFMIKDLAHQRLR